MSVERVILAAVARADLALLTLARVWTGVLAVAVVAAWVGMRRR